MGATHLLRTLFAGLLATAVLASALPATLAQAEDEVSIPDAGLKTCISSQLANDKLPGDLTASNLARLVHLYCNSSRNASITDLTGIQALTGARGISISNLTTTDISPLATLTNLTGLQLADPQLEEAAPLVSLTSLATLILDAPAVTDYSFLAGFTSLRGLDLRLGPTFDPTSVPSLPSLRTVVIRDPNQDALALPAKFPGITHLTLKSQASTLSELSLPDSLTWLTIDDAALTRLPQLAATSSATKATLYTRSLTTLDGIQAFPQLRTLQAPSSANLQDVSALSQDSHLAEFAAGPSKIDSLASFSELTELRTLRVPQAALTDLGPLRDLQLTTLDVSGNRIRTLAPLTGMQLESFTATNLGITSLDAPGLLHAGAKVVLAYNNLGAEPGLESVAEAGTLDLSHNQLTDVRGLAGLTATASVDLSYNQIKDFSPIPDTVQAITKTQVVPFLPSIKAEKPFDFGLRSVTGDPICPTITPATPCQDGVATFATAGTYELSGAPDYVFITPFYVREAIGQFVTMKPSLPEHAKVESVLDGNTGFAWNPMPTSWQVDWYRDDVLVRSDVSTSWESQAFRVGVADFGHRITVCRTGSRDEFATARTCSDPVKIEPGVMVNTSGPSYKGAPYAGRTMTVRHGGWPSGARFTYTWYVNGHRVKTTTTPKLKLKRSYRNKMLRVRVTITKTGYATVNCSTRSQRIR